MRGTERNQKMKVQDWKGCRAQFWVKTAGKPGKGNRRHKKLQREKEALRVGLSRSPYVEIEIEDTCCRALVDSGADWSMLDYTALTPSEVEGLTESHMSGQGVSSEPISVVGEVWRDVKLGGLVIPKQRFVVIRNMVTSTILGADFWVRLGELTLDFKGGSLRVPKFNLEVRLFETDTQLEDSSSRLSPVHLSSDVTVPPHSEIVVEGLVNNGIFEGKQVLLEPKIDDESPTNVPFTVCRVRDGRLWVRIANISNKDVQLCQGEQVGNATDNVAVLARGKQNFSKKKGARYAESKIGEQLDPKQRQELLDLLDEFSEVFYDGGELPLVRVGVEHTIRVKDDTGPVAFNPRRVSREAEEELQKEVKSLEEMGIIQPSNSPWAAPVVCARRSDGSLRLAVDYRALNAVSLPATLHPIPRVDGLIDRLSEAKFFATLDAKCGYHQMPLKEGEEDITAFVVPFGQYEFCRGTPFGLKGAGYSFQRFMSVILGESNFTDAVCYLDDVLVWGPTWEVFMDRLKRVMKRIAKAGLALSPKKCCFGVEEVYYLGALIKNGKVCIGEQRTTQLVSIPRPMTLQELRSALGAFSYVQRWLPGLAEVNRPLYELMKSTGQGMKLKWTEQCEKAFCDLKQMVAEAVQLRIPVDGIPFTLVTDASDSGTGAMLSQKVEEDLIPVAFYHHALTQEEVKYNTTERELLAVVKACKKFRVYLTEAFDLITDHSALRWLNSLDAEDCRGRRARWIDFLQQFDMNVIHKKGKNPMMSMADYLSRVRYDGSVQATVAPLRMTEENRSSFMDDTVDIGELRKAQQSDQEIETWVKAVGSNWDGFKVQDRPQAHDRMILDDDGLLRVRYNGGRKTKKNPFGVRVRFRLVVPKTEQRKAMALCHDTPLAGHMGIKRTWKRAVETFWWQGMKQDIQQYVKDCEKCGVNKHTTKISKAPVQKTDVPAKVLDKIQVDFLGPFGVSTAHEYRYALQIQDVLSRYVRFVPTIRSDAETAAVTVFDEWVCILGFPLTVQSDQGRHFAGQVFKEMCRLNGMVHRMGSVGHAQSQGQVERQNQLMNQVRALCDNDINRWPEALARIQHAHNTSINEVTGVSPHEVMFAQRPNLPENTALMEAKEVRERTEKVSVVEGNNQSMGRNQLAREKLKSVLIDVCRENTITHQDKVFHNQEFKAIPYKVGSLVRMKLNTVQKNVLGGKKIAPKNTEPYVVVRVAEHCEWTYDLVKLAEKDNPSIKVKRRHFNELVPCYRSGGEDLKDPIDECYWITYLDRMGRDNRKPDESSAKTGPPVETEQETTLPESIPERRYPTRDRKPTNMLKMSWGNAKKYDEMSVGSRESSAESSSDMEELGVGGQNPQ